MKDRELTNKLNLPYDKFVIHFSSVEEFGAFEKLIEKAFEMRFITDFKYFNLIYPIYASFSIIESNGDAGLLIQPDDLQKYFYVEDLIVHPYLFDMSDIYPVEELLNEIATEVRKSDITILGLQ